MTTLDEVTAGLDAALPPGDVGDAVLTGADRTGVAVVAADHADPAGEWPRSGAFGYGLSVERARVAAHAELAEEMLLSRHLRTLEPVRASYTELRGSRGADRVADPVSLVLPAGTAYDPDRPRWWLPTTRWRTGEEVLVPAEFAAAYPVDLDWQPAGERLATVITNGCGAGDTVERAVAHALGELLQRDGNATAFRALDRGVVIDTDGVTDPDTRRLLDHLADVGITVIPKLASTAFGVTDLHVVGYDTDVADAPHPVTVTAAGEAADPDREVALQKALLEFCSARVRKIVAHADLDTVRPLFDARYWERELAHPVPPQERRAFEAMTDWTSRGAGELRDLLAPTVLSRRETVAFTDLPHTPGLDTPAAQLDDLLARLDGFDVLALVADAGSAVTTKVIVPGLEVETMSYGRIGARGVERLLERGSDLVGLGAPPHPGAAPVLLTAEGRERLGGDAWLDRAAVDRTVGELYPLYREPTRHAVARAAAGEAVDLR
ncbi:hypothetical protein GCM10023200_03640 [Actinomycetospora chlora]|uniref:YcaO domain-containing protein n=1 Tax=Actinomycetospora chlora TaxID=663608 RepID=A0ABP9A6F0_9PSEU